MKLFSEEEVKIWVEEELAALEGEAIILGYRERACIVQCLWGIMQWYVTKNSSYLSNFTEAVVTNDFREACFIADSTNAKVLPLYARFLYNCMPADYRELARELRFGE